MEQIENPMILPQYEYRSKWSDEDLAILEDMQYEDTLNEQD